MASGGDIAQSLDYHEFPSGEIITNKDDIHSTVTLFKLPERARAIIWSYLDFEGLKSVSETSTQLEEEILQFIAPLNGEDVPTPDHVCTLVDVIPILSFSPLRKYLDLTSKRNLRLVCRDLAIIVDHYWIKPWLDSSLSRWGSEGGSESFATGSDYVQDGNKEVECNRILPTIFDILTQDLKRIFSYLEDSDLESLEDVCESFSRLVKELRKYPFQENKDSSTVITLMDLPTEIHEKILKSCRACDRPTLRLVSKLMQFQVDTLAGVSVFLNDLKWTWGGATLGKLPPASELIVTKIENLQSIKYFVSEYNGRLLTRLILDGPFLAGALIKIFRLCKNLRFIGFTYALDMASLEDEIRKLSLRSRDLPMELYSLKSLDLKVREDDLPQNNIFRVHAWSWVNAFEMMKPTLVFMPRLSSFRICEEAIFNHKLLYEVANKVLKFIVEHRQTLKYMEVILLGSCFRACICPPFQSEVAEDDLKNLRLKKYAHDCDWRISRPFTVILNAQRNLEELSCFKLSDWEFYAGIMLQNCVTLRSVTIEKNLAPVIDLGSFGPCKNLEYLLISQGGSSNIRRQRHYADPDSVRIIRFEPRLINLHKLPIGIKSLHILDQTTDPAQINTIPRRLRNLETLELQFLGSWDGKSFGMTDEIVAEILQLRKLNSLFLEEIQTRDFHFTHRQPEILSQINLIPKECFQKLDNCRCVVVGTLIAEQLPSPDFMPEWSARVDSYLAVGNTPYTFEEYNVPRPQIIIESSEDEEEEAEQEDEDEDESSDHYESDN